MESLTEEQSRKLSALCWAILITWPALLLAGYAGEQPFAVHLAAPLSFFFVPALTFIFVTGSATHSTYWMIPLLAVCGSAFIWGITDPFYWDGILTFGRSIDVYLGDPVQRFSLTYLICGYLFVWVSQANWVGHGYVMLTGLILLVTGRRLHRGGAGWLFALLLLIIPHVFVLSKWFYMDLPVITMTFVTAVTVEWAIRKQGGYFGWRMGLAMLALLITVSLKEVGFMACLAFWAPLFFAKGRERWKAALLALSSAALAAAVFIPMAAIYTNRNLESGGGHVEWFLFRDDKIAQDFGDDVYVSDTIRWALRMAREYMEMLLWWNFGLFALLRLIKVKGRRGCEIFSAVFLLQLLIFYAVSDFDIEKRFHHHPLKPDDHSVTTSRYLFLFIVGLMASGLFSKDLSIRLPGRFEFIGWLITICVLFFFSSSGKIYRHHDGLGPVTDWRYIGVISPFIVYFAFRSLMENLSPRFPQWYRFAAGLTFSVSVLFVATRSFNMAQFYSEKAQLNQIAFEIASQSEELRVFQQTNPGQPLTFYSHWPFMMQARFWDYGSLRWASAGLIPREIEWMQADAGKSEFAGKPALIVYTWHAYRRENLEFKHPREIGRRTETIHYIKPLEPLPGYTWLEMVRVAQVNWDALSDQSGEARNPR